MEWLQSLQPEVLLPLKERPVGRSRVWPTRTTQHQFKRTLVHLLARSLGVPLVRMGQEISALSKISKVDFRLVGRERKMLWVGCTTWTIPQERRHGRDQRQLLIELIRECEWSRPRRWSDEHIKTECFLRIVLAPTPLIYQTNSKVLPVQTMLVMLRLWLLVPPPTGPENFRLDGSKDTPLKEDPTLWTTIPEQPHGWILEGSSTSECTVRTTMVAFKLNLFPSSELFRVDGK